MMTAPVLPDGDVPVNKQLFLASSITSSSLSRLYSPFSSYLLISNRTLKCILFVLTICLKLTYDSLRQQLNKQSAPDTTFYVVLFCDWGELFQFIVIIRGQKSKCSNAKIELFWNVLVCVCVPESRSFRWCRLVREWLITPSTSATWEQLWQEQSHMNYRTSWRRSVWAVCMLKGLFCWFIHCVEDSPGRFLYSLSFSI